MNVPLLPLAIAAAASLVASFSYAGDLACVTLSAGKLAALATGDGPHAPVFARFLKDRDKILSRWLIVRVVALSLAAALLVDFANAAGVPHLRLAIALGGSVLLYGTLAEILATIARRRPETVAILALRLLRLFEVVAIPVADPLVLLGHAVGGQFPETRVHDARITETEVHYAVTEGERAGTLAEEPAEMIRNVLDFKDLTVRDVMVPRRRVSAIELSTEVDQVLELVATDGHSRYPVYRETLDNVVGLVYAKDLFAYAESGDKSKSLTDLVRKQVLVVVEFQSALSVLREMRSKRLHMAIVADEFGGTEGIVTLEDILEEIVGEIHDEYDTDAPIHELGDGRFVADAAIPISDLEGHLGKSLPTDGDFESLGGLLVHRAGRVPDVGASITLDGVRFIVREADETRVVKVEIVQNDGRRRLPSKSEEAPA
ncbi:MAG: HlyC/CorC family transporter [Polyangiaceae bacterium]|nr:HlyC/CorC family transporter [Polyangiaceae bacterium]